MIRNYSIDLVKTLATFFVISVHFFLNTGFYNLNLGGPGHFTLIVFRNLFMTCVPLFMICTGYLLYSHSNNKRHYLGLINTLIKYILISLIGYAISCVLSGDVFSIRTVLKGLIEFTLSPYGWYVNMYIGLYLISPFLNVLFHNIEKKELLSLIFVLSFLTFLPSAFNSFNYLIFPNWWVSLYPITYYIIGFYLRNYKTDINRMVLLAVSTVSLLTISAICYMRFKGGNFIFSSFSDFSSLYIALVSICIFVLLLNTSNENKNHKLMAIVKNISNRSLEIYLISFIFDRIFYISLSHYELYNDKVPYFFLIVPIVFLFSLLTSNLLSITYPLISKYLYKIS